MTRTSWFVSFFTLLTVGATLSASAVRAQVPLTRAEIDSLQNQVQLMPQNQAARNATVQDVMLPGDRLATGQRALADLLFNDGSLARVGEQAVFRFQPQTRNFQLSNGTVLLLIPPGQGQTRLQTPNVTTGIRGSGLWVRYDATRDATLVGTLTDSGIEVINRDGTQRQVLAAGQMLVAVGDHFEALYDFNLAAFYRSPIMQGLPIDPALLPAEVAVNSLAIAAVQAEILDGLASQAEIPPREFVPVEADFVTLTPIATPAALVDIQFDTQAEFTPLAATDDLSLTSPATALNAAALEFQQNIPGISRLGLETEIFGTTDISGAAGEFMPELTQDILVNPGNPGNPGNSGNPGNLGDPGNPGNPTNPDNGNNRSQRAQEVLDALERGERPPSNNPTDNGNAGNNGGNNGNAGGNGMGTP